MSCLSNKRIAVFVDVRGGSMVCVLELLMLVGVTMGGGQNRRKEECHTFHYLIQIVSLGDKRQDI